MDGAKPLFISARETMLLTYNYLVNVKYRKRFLQIPHLSNKNTAYTSKVAPSKLSEF
jgi:hypothetical protein